MINHLGIQGRLVEDAKCGQTNGGVDYANFRIAWSEKYKDKENKCFLECKAFGATAKFIGQYLGTKGTELIVEGKLNTEEWEKDGQKRSRIVLIVDRAHFCGKRDGGSAGSAAATAEPEVNMTSVDTDELPF